MTQPSRVTSPPSQQDYASHSPRQHNISSSSSSSPHHVESRSAGMHHFEHIAGAYPGVIVVDPSMMPPGYVIGQVAARVEEPEEPLYVNAKQYHRILKRRAARANLEAQNRLLQRGRKFMHESRHLHAMRRPRGPGGRFLTAAEIAALDSKSPTEDEDTNDHHHNHQHNQHHNNNSNDNSNSSSNNSAYNSSNHGYNDGQENSKGYSQGQDQHSISPAASRQGVPLESSQGYGPPSKTSAIRAMNSYHS